MSGSFDTPQPPKRPRPSIDLDRAALLLVGGGLILFVLLNQLGSIGAYFAPVFAALMGDGYGWFDSKTHDGLFFKIPDLLLYAGVVCFAARRIGGVWERYRHLNIFAIFARAPGPQSSVGGSGPGMDGPGARVPDDEQAPDDAFAEWEEPSEDPEAQTPEGAPPSSSVAGAWADEPPADPTDPILAGPSAWRVRLSRAYAILTARREGAPKAKSERARDALRMLLLPPGMKAPDDDDGQPGNGPS
jgi:hypothetical protein